MEAVGHLTGGIAHDFNNILGIVLGNLELLKRQVGADENALRRVEKAISGAKRGAKLTSKLLSFSRKAETSVKLTEVNRSIENLEELIAKSLTASVEVKTVLASDLWPVRVNSDELEDMLLNLSLNARDSMPDGGNLTIETSNKMLDEAYVRLNPDGQIGDFVQISVTDTGVGMTDETMASMYEPFFTTKEVGSGTGLGLSMVYGFVQRSGGHLTASSQVGKGTTFRIYLPRTEDEGDDNVTSSEIDHLPTGDETILIVDDERDLRETAGVLLQEMGYTTLSAGDGAEAVGMLESHPEIDLLFSDVVMPGGMDGYQLAEQANKMKPGLRILLASGFTKRVSDQSGENSLFASNLAKNLLKKPYRASDLAVAIRRCLDEEANI
jgi:CheY-like chemotaxis protein